MPIHRLVHIFLTQSLLLPAYLDGVPNVNLAWCSALTANRGVDTPPLTLTQG
jgi:hypothetical protein